MKMANVYKLFIGTTSGSFGLTAFYASDQMKGLVELGQSFMEVLVSGHSVLKSNMATIGKTTFFLVKVLWYKAWIFFSGKGQ